jgi:FkbM family methyltransferase
MPQVVTVRGHTFLADGLKAGSVVIDLGANRGEFSRDVAARFGAKCLAVEASPDTARNIPAADNVRVLNYAITDHDGPVSFNLSMNSEMSSVHPSNVPSGSKLGTVDVQGRTLESLLRECAIDRADLLKVDIEGAEVQLFGPRTSDEALRRIAQITIEFHDFTGAMTRSDVDTIVRRLTGLGFYPVRFSHTNMDWLFVRPDALRLGPLARWWVRYVVRNWRFLKRNLGGSRE